MRWLLDGHVLIDALAGLPHGKRVLHEARNRHQVSVIFSAITKIEILGFPKLSEQEENGIRTLLNEFAEIPISNAIVEQTILIRKSARIKVPDALIAATALVNQAVLVTRNTIDFQKVLDLTVAHPDSV